MEVIENILKGFDYEVADIPDEWAWWWNEVIPASRCW